MRKRRCADCAFYQKVTDRYYDGCDAGPMPTRPNDPKCLLFRPKPKPKGEGLKAKGKWRKLKNLITRKEGFSPRGQ